MSVQVYYPEMGHAKPEAEIEAKLAIYSNKYRLKTTLTLKGRGIKFDSVINGKNVYYATPLAYQGIKAKHTVSMECLLD